jgi:hypothetical protein
MDPSAHYQRLGLGWYTEKIARLWYFVLRLTVSKTRA